MPMDSNKIQELLEKYWNCETSLEEEQHLREYFRGREIPEQFKETAALFRYFDNHKSKTLTDAGFDASVRKKIGTPDGKLRRLFYNSMRIAAGIAVLVLATFFVRNEIRKSTPEKVVDTYDDPKLALEETKKALLMISKTFGTAKDKAKNINMFNEAQEKIQNDSKKESEL